MVQGGRYPGGAPAGSLATARPTPALLISARSRACEMRSHAASAERGWGSVPRPIAFQVCYATPPSAFLKGDPAPSGGTARHPEMNQARRGVPLVHRGADVGRRRQPDAVCAAGGGDTETRQGGRLLRRASLQHHPQRVEASTAKGSRGVRPTVGRPTAARSPAPGDRTARLIYRTRSPANSCERKPLAAASLLRQEDWVVLVDGGQRVLEPLLVHAARERRPAGLGRCVQAGAG